MSVEIVQITYSQCQVHLESYKISSSSYGYISDHVVFRGIKFRRSVDHCYGTLTKIKHISNAYMFYNREKLVGVCDLVRPP